MSYFSTVVGSVSPRLIRNWIVGLLAGTGIIAVTSPLFVRSYLPLRIDPVRGFRTLPPGHIYRWRSEGYADTFIGPLGMPGRPTLELTRLPSTRVALWGDSQAEGVCVSDDLKLHARIELASDGGCSVFPLAQSGEDASVWLTEMPAIERELGVDVHLILVVDLPDLLAATKAPVPPARRGYDETFSVIVASYLPAFVIQGARHLLTGADQQTPRQLRFAVGPVPAVSESPATRATEVTVGDWRAATDAIRAATELPVVIVYAPQAPQIIDGTVRMNDGAAREFQAMQAAAIASGLIVIDMHDPFCDAVRSGIWPRGFQNGYIGSGHLNSDGYRIIAPQVVEAIERMPDAVASREN